MFMPNEVSCRAAGGVVEMLVDGRMALFHERA
jgi:hypothetical protein